MDDLVTIVRKKSPEELKAYILSAEMNTHRDEVIISYVKLVTLLLFDIQCEDNEYDSEEFKVYREFTMPDKWQTDSDDLEFVLEVLLEKEEIQFSSFPHMEELIELLYLLPSLKEIHIDRTAEFNLDKFFEQIPFVCKLKLVECSISELPASIGKLTKLEFLNLSKNQINFLPAEFTELKKLAVLELEDNILEQFPQVITGLNKLESLTINGNRISGDLPKEIGEMAGLSYLNLDKNDFRNLDAMKNLPKVAVKLTNNPNCILSEDILSLKKLSISGSQVSLLKNIRSIEELLIDKGDHYFSFSEFSHIQGLKRLSISDAQITSFREIENFNDLEYLSLGFCNLTEFYTGICELVKLTEVKLPVNAIKIIPEEIVKLENLRILNLNNNKIESVPLSLFSIKNLESVDLYYNKLSDDEKQKIRSTVVGRIKVML